MILPHQFGLVTASKDGAIKPDASSAEGGLEDKPANSDQAKGLGNRHLSVCRARNEGTRVHRAKM
jgi:hypothetical protein